MEKLGRWIQRGDRALAAGEQRVGRVAVALAVGVGLMVFAGLYASENFIPLGFGTNYAKLSQDPFRFDQPDLLQYRLFAPVVGHYLGLRGNLFPILTHGASLIFLALLYLAARRRAWSPSEAVGLAATMATSVNVLWDVHFPGMTDTVSYLGLLLALLARGPCGYAAGAGIALLNHEGNIFALPWLLAYRLYNERTTAGRLATLLATGVALAGLACLRAWLHRHITSPLPLAPDSYLNVANTVEVVTGNLPNLWLGVFGAFKLLWLLPALAVFHEWKSGNRCRSGSVMLVVICAAGQLVLAGDLTRLMGLAFPAVLAGALVMRERLGPERFSPWLWRLLLVNLLVPTTVVFLGGRITTFYPLPVTILVQLLFGVPL